MNVRNTLQNGQARSQRFYLFGRERKRLEAAEETLDILASEAVLRPAVETVRACSAPVQAPGERLVLLRAALQEVDRQFTVLTTGALAPLAGVALATAGSLPERQAEIQGAAQAELARQGLPWSRLASEIAPDSQAMTAYALGLDAKGAAYDLAARTPDLLERFPELARDLEGTLGRSHAGPEVDRLTDALAGVPLEAEQRTRTLARFLERGGALTPARLAGLGLEFAPERAEDFLHRLESLAAPEEQAYCRLLVRSEGEAAARLRGMAQGVPADVGQGLERLSGLPRGPETLEYLFSLARVPGEESLVSLLEGQPAKACWRAMEAYVASPAVGLAGALKVVLPQVGRDGALEALEVLGRKTADSRLDMAASCLALTKDDETLLKGLHWLATRPSSANAWGELGALAAELELDPVDAARAVGPGPLVDLMDQVAAAAPGLPGEQGEGAAAALRALGDRVGASPRARLAGAGLAWTRRLSRASDRRNALSACLETLPGLTPTEAMFRATWGNLEGLSPWTQVRLGESLLLAIQGDQLSSLGQAATLAGQWLRDPARRDPSDPHLVALGSQLLESLAPLGSDLTRQYLDSLQQQLTEHPVDWLADQLDRFADVYAEGGVVLAGDDGTAPTIEREEEQVRVGSVTLPVRSQP